MVKKKYFFVFVCVLTIGAIVWRQAVQPERYKVSTEKYQAIVNEVMSVDFPYRYLTPDDSGAMLAYVHEAEQGRGLFFMDLKTKERQQAPITNEVTKMFGWSPDDRYLVFAQTPPHLPEVKTMLGNTWSKEEWLTIYDRKEKTFKRITTSRNSIESRFVWLTTNSYFFVSRHLAKTNADAYIGSLNTEPRRICDYDAVMDNFVPVRDNVVAYTYKGEVWELDLGQCTNTSAIIDVPSLDKKVRKNNDIPKIKPVQISHMQRTRGFPQLQWLRYDRQKGHYLFCAVPKNSNWRYLYRWDPKQRKLYQNSKEDTYNGQFIENGNGVVYVRNSNFVFSLTIKTKGKSGGTTNFFQNGGVSSYAASPSGDRVFAVAWEGHEPAGIWEYELSTQKLSLLASGFNRPFVTSRVIEAQEGWLKSFDGLEVPYFLYQPLDVFLKCDATNGMSKRVKYPVAIYAPPPSAAVNRIFNARMQLLANLGFYVLAVNYRGCQGYGAKYASLDDLQAAAKDLIAGHEMLSRMPDTDMERAFLLSDSGGNAVVNTLLRTQPQLWRAVSLENPGGISYQDFDPAALPPIFFAVGDQDGGYESLMNFKAWAGANGASVSSIVYTNSGHITYKTDQRKDKLDRVAKFLISHL